MNTPEDIAQLLFRHVRNELGPEEEGELLDWRGLSPENEQVFRDATDPEYMRREISFIYETRDRVFNKILEQYPLPETPTKITRARNYRMLRIAAIIIVSLGVTLYLLFGINVGSVPVKKNPKAGYQTVFINAEGISTALDDIQRGFRDGYASKPSSEIGGIPVFYATSDPLESKGKFNMLRTLKGGRICLQLPDGTLVWLNELSSVTYSANYSVDSERISVAGEVYVELTENKNASTPFHVSIGNMEFEVTEGRFNARAYASDSITLTAIDGNVRLDIRQSASHVLLHPHEQALIIKGKINLRHNPDILKVLDWKNRE